MYLIRDLAKKYNLTRTTLLHYDKIDLLKPSARSEAGYRLYNDEDDERLQKIVLFRSMGISLKVIKILIGSQQSRLANILMQRLNELNLEIKALKDQQQNIIDLLDKVKILEKHFSAQKEDIDQFALLCDIDPVNWHLQFEAISPEMHKKFLKLLQNIPEELKLSLRMAMNRLSDAEKKKLNRIHHKNNPGHGNSY